jgi:hypothetical protein
MREILLLLGLAGSILHGQPVKVSQKVEGDCSAAISGSNNRLDLTCVGLDPKLGGQILNLVNLIASKQLDPDAVMAKLEKLDENNMVLRELQVIFKDQEKLKDFLRDKYQEIFSSSELEASAWADQLVKSLPERLREVAELDRSAESLAAEYQLKWEPLYEFFLHTFDARIEALNKAGVVVKLYKKDLPVIVRTESGQPYQQIRRANFANYSLLVRFEPGVLQYGKLLQNPLLLFQEQNVSGPRICDVRFGVKDIHLRAGKKYSDLDYGFLTDDPMSNPELRKRVEDIINRAITFAMIRSETDPH